MELWTLDSNFQPTRIVENYSSLIWTERYSSAGDFTLETSEVALMMDLLPLESWITLRESTVPMIVETHKIEKAKNVSPVLTVTGRSFETILERRGTQYTALQQSYDTVPTDLPIQAVKPSDAAYILMRTVLGDIARTMPDGVTPAVGPLDPAVSPLDAFNRSDGSSLIDLRLPLDYEIPTVVGMPSAWDSSTYYIEGAVVSYNDAQWIAVIANTGVAPTLSTPEWDLLYSNYAVEKTDLYSKILDLLATNNHGLKTVRPQATGNQVGFEIYNGANLTGSGPNSDLMNVVVFDARFDQFDDAKYLLSKQGSVNVAYVLGSKGAQQVLKTTVDSTHPEPSSLDRRVTVLDASQDTSVSTPDIIKSRGLIELYNHNVTAMFDGEISVQIASGYNRDYFLGDIIKLTGEYNLSEDARVAEFIRSSDSSGEKAYPTLQAVDAI